MLSLLSKSYFAVASLLYLILAFKSPLNYSLIHLYAILNFISFYIILYININFKNGTYSNITLIIEVFVYTLFFLFLENSLSYYYHNNFFIFSESDALFYHNTTIKLLNMPFSKAIDYYLNFMGIDDLGIILLLYPLYLINPSNITLNIFYLFVAIITAFALYDLAKKFMSKKYAFLTSLTYSISSFTIFFHGTGLKESFMIMLIVLSFASIYRFFCSKNIFYLLVALITLALIIFFRPAIIAMIALSFAIGALFANKGGVFVKIFALFIFIVMLVMHKYIADIVKSYTAGGIDALIYARETQGMIKGGLTFTYLVNLLSQLIGPLPTLLSSSKILTIFYAPGLIFRVLLAIPFWLALYFIYKNRVYKLYPIVIFVVIEMLSLVFLIDGLELRKAMPHIPFVFLIAFWFIDAYDSKKIGFLKEENFKNLFIFMIFILTILMVYWNFR